MLNFITSDPRFNIVSLALAVLSVVLAIIFYYRSKSVKIPCYGRKSQTLVTPELMEHSPLRVTFNSKPVETLTMTYVAFWNDGKATIGGEDVAATDPLRIVADEKCDILAAEIICSNRPANGFKVNLRRQDRVVHINFDFVDNKNGVVIRIYHTGQENQDIDIIGTIKGANGILNVDRADERAINTIERVDKWFKERLFLLAPKRLLDLDFEAEARQNLILSFLVSLPLTILLSPFIAVYVMVMVLLIFITMMRLLFAKRYTMPKELYLRMKY
jgi:hypothetical protein